MYEAGYGGTYGRICLASVLRSHCLLNTVIGVWMVNSRLLLCVFVFLSFPRLYDVGAFRWYELPSASTNGTAAGHSENAGTHASLWNVYAVSCANWVDVRKDICTAPQIDRDKDRQIEIVVDSECVGSCSFVGIGWVSRSFTSSESIYGYLQVYAWRVHRAAYIFRRQGHAYLYVRWGYISSRCGLRWPHGDGLFQFFRSSFSCALVYQA